MVPRSLVNSDSSFQWGLNGEFRLDPCAQNRHLSINSPIAKNSPVDYTWEANRYTKCAWSIG